MAKVSISEAARLAGISRTNFYKNYVKPGKITVEKDHQDKPQVDTAEILRVFGKLQGVQAEDTQEEQKVTAESAEVLQERIRGLEALLEAKETLIEAQQKQLDTLGRLIEDKSPVGPKKRSWWPF